jgi:uncharacterized protein (DUF433 family)
MAKTKDARISQPLYTIDEAASYLGVRPGTFRDWVKGRPGSPSVVHSLPSVARREATIPFVGLTEGLVVAAFRRAGGSMQYIRKAVEALKKDIDLEYALASKRLFAHGAQILWDHSDDDEIRQLAEVVTKNRVFDEVVAGYLELITYGDELATQIVLPGTERPVVKVDPNIAFGQPVFLRGGSRMQDAVDRFVAGDSPESVARDFDVPEADLHEVLRARLRRAA